MRTAAFVSFLLFASLFLAQPAPAQERRISRYIEPQDTRARQVGENTYEYEVRERLDPGTALRLNVDERPVQSVEVRLRREGRERDTYVKAGFDPERGFENNRREQVDRNELYSVRWNADDRRPQDRPLEVAAFNGDVYVERVVVEYADSGRAREDYGYGGGYERGRMTDRDEGRYGYRDDPAARRCRQMDIPEPQFRIQNREQLASAITGLLTGQSTLQGELSGQCIAEAGYYLNGRLVQRIDFPLDDRFNRQQFSLQINPSENGELRAATIDGREEVVPVQNALRR